MKRYLLASAAALFGALNVNPVAAAPNADDRWLPYQGCWRAVEGPAGNLTCIVPEGTGVRVVELMNGTVVRETQMSADNQPRPIEQEGCSGTERSRWAASGNRLYVSTEMTCGERIPRTSSGLFAIVSPSEWVSITAIAVDEEAATRTVRYVVVESPANVPESLLTPLQKNRLARETARYAANVTLTLADIREASKEVHGRTVEALVHARQQTFALNGKTLVGLADAGVPEYLIDAVVAVSNPDKFEVRGLEPVEVTAPVAGADTPARSCSNIDLWYDRYCDYGYSRYGYGYGFGYSPYSSFGGYNNYYGYRGAPIIVVIDPNAEQPEVRQPGRVTRNGYQPGRSTGSSSSTARSVTPTTSSSKTESSTSSSSSSSRGKAKPRGGN